MTGKRTEAAKQAENQTIKGLEKQLEDAEGRLARLYDAIENGTVELDETLKKRIQTQKAAKESALVELASARRQTSSPPRGFCRATSRPSARRSASGC